VDEVISSEHGERTGSPLVLYAEQLTTMSSVRDHPRYLEWNKYQPARYRRQSQSYILDTGEHMVREPILRLPQKTEALSRFA
jgi:hypothetical protein